LDAPQSRLQGVADIRRRLQEGFSAGEVLIRSNSPTSHHPAWILL